MDGYELESDNHTCTGDDYVHMTSDVAALQLCLRIQPRSIPNNFPLTASYIVGITNNSLRFNGILNILN